MRLSIEICRSIHLRNARSSSLPHVPLALILISVLELSGAPALGLHLLGGGLTIARVAHPFGFDWDVATKPARIVGAGLTGLATVVASIWAIWTVVF